MTGGWDAVVYVANTVVRLLIVFAPMSLRGFSFNETTIVEVREALNAHGSRLLLCWWCPSALVPVVLSAAARSDGNISLFPFLVAAVSCCLIAWILWKKFPGADTLRSRASTIVVALALMVVDVAFYFLAHRHVVDWIASDGAARS